MREATNVHRHRTSPSSIALNTTASSTVLARDRELRWLSASASLLNEAEDPLRRLWRRVRSLGVLSRRLDKFFSNGMSPDPAKAALNHRVHFASGTLDATRRREIRRRVTTLVARQYRCWWQSILPALARESVQVIPHAQLDREMLQAADRIFEETVFPILTPMAIDASHPKPYFRDKALYLAALLRCRARGGPRRMFGVVEVPARVPRFVPLGADGGDALRTVLLEQLIGARLDRLFGGYEVIDWATCRFTRGKGLCQSRHGIESDDRSFSTRVDVPRRGAVVRLEIARGVSQQLLRSLTRIEESCWATDESDQYGAVYLIPGPINLGDLLKLARLARARERRARGAQAEPGRQRI